MFSILCNNLRYTASCNIKKGKFKNDVDTVIDTGARWTTYVAEQVNPNLKLFQFANAESKRIGGLINESDNKIGKETNNKRNELTAVFYRYDIDNFVIENINLGKQSIWVTFDDKIKDNLLGLDILEQTTHIHFVNSGTLTFFNNEDELKDYLERLKPIERVYYEVNPTQCCIELYNMYCYFDKSRIMFDNINKREFIVLDGRSNKICYLTKSQK